MRQFFLSYSDNRVFLYILFISLCFLLFTGCAHPAIFRIKEEKNDINWSPLPSEKNLYLRRPKLLINNFIKGKKNHLKNTKFQETPTNTFETFSIPKPPEEYYKP